MKTTAQVKITSVHSFFLTKISTKVYKKSLLALIIGSCCYLTACDNTTTANPKNQTESQETSISLSSKEIVTAKAERYQPNLKVSDILYHPSETLFSTTPASIDKIHVQLDNLVKPEMPLMLLKSDSIASAPASTPMTASAIASQATEDTLNITSPLFGKVSQIFVKVGDKVPADQPLIEVIDNVNFAFSAILPNDIKSQLHIGQSVPFTLANNPKQFAGQINKISDHPDNEKHEIIVNVLVKATPDTTQLSTGQVVNAEIDLGQIQVGVLLPMSAVTLDSVTPNVKNPTSGKVWIIGQDQRLSQKSVRIIETDNNHQQYLVDGIEQGTLVANKKLSNDSQNKKATLQ